MIEDKLKISAEKLPVPQSTFQNIVEIMALKPKCICHWKWIRWRIVCAFTTPKR